MKKITISLGLFILLSTTMNYGMGPGPDKEASKAWSCCSLKAYLLYNKHMKAIQEKHNQKINNPPHENCKTQWKTSVVQVTNNLQEQEKMILLNSLKQCYKKTF